VMYAGQIVEQGTLRDIVRTPVHPYAKGLLASTIHGAKRGARLETIPGTPPSLGEKPHNCSFAPRCKQAEPRCLEQLPPNVEVAPGRAARCVRAGGYALPPARARWRLGGWAPPLGGLGGVGLGWGVATNSLPAWGYPLPAPPPQGGRE
jgi:oligopeptide/dipeptide ABC transporter ATP-binding protein